MDHRVAICASAATIQSIRQSQEMSTACLQSRRHCIHVCRWCHDSGSHPNKPSLLSHWSPLFTAMQVLSGLGQAITNVTQVATQCMSLPAVWRDSPAAVDAELYCGWRRSGCTSSSGNSGAIRPVLHAETCMKDQYTCCKHMQVCVLYRLYVLQTACRILQV